VTTIIKNGTIVTADLTYKADVLIDEGIITAIGPNLKGDEVLDATGCFIMPGGIDPHTHLEMPFMGTYSTDDFESGTRAALSGGTTMLVDFVLPGQGQGLMDAAQMWHNKSGRASCDYSYHMAITWWGQKVWDDMADSVKAGITSFKHFMAYKGALMVNDDELFASFRRVGDLGGLARRAETRGEAMPTQLAKCLTMERTRCRFAMVSSRNVRVCPSDVVVALGFML
jgi:dihydropyrimidinase